MMKAVAVLLIAIGLGGGVYMFFFPDPPAGWLRPEFQHVRYADIFHALATISSASLIAMALMPTDDAWDHPLILWLARSLFMGSTAVLLLSLFGLNSPEWRCEPFLSFAILIAGGLITLAIETRNDAVELSAASSESLVP